MEAAFQEALAHHRAGRLEEAEAIYRRISHWRPAWTLGNLGVILRVTGRLEAAETALRGALAHEPDNVKAQRTLGMTLLQLGRYAEGYALFEARHRLFQRPTREFSEWKGESLRGRRILVLAEQGLGDQILWARFLPLLAAEAAEVAVAVSSRVAPLLADMPVRLLAGDSWRHETADVWTSIGSAPRWLGANPQDAPPPYLCVGPHPGPTGQVGLMLQGGPKNPNLKRIPPPAVQRAIRGLLAAVDLSPEATGARHFGDTARLLLGLDRVVSVDTSVAHLAGAMAWPCLTLLPRPAEDWYAGWTDDRSPWYPTMRTIRQPAPGDWATVLAALNAALLTPSAAMTET